MTIRRTFDSPLSGLYVQMPMLVAEMRQDHHFFPRGNMIYLVRPDLIDADTCDCLIKGRLRLHRYDLTWEYMRLLEVKLVASDIAERCWRASPEDMEALAERIRSEKLCEELDFSSGVDLD